jgi:hypothetical protein
MKDFLKKIKLIDDSIVNLEINREEFVERLSMIVDKGSVSMYSNPFEIFSSSKNEFIGQVNSNRFLLKRRRRIFDMNQNVAIAKGVLTELNGKLIIETEINGFKSFFIVFYIALLIFYSVFAITLINSDNSDTIFSILFLLIHGALMFSIPYFLMRRSVKKMKYELERELFFLTKNN